MRTFFHFILAIALISLIYMVWKLSLAIGFFGVAANSLPEEVQQAIPIRTEPIATSTTIYVVGDMIFDRAVRKATQLKGFEGVFGDSRELFTGHDIVLGNLEGPITTFASKTLFKDGTMSKELTFTFPTTTAPALKNVGMNVVSLANNHTQNFGQQGIVQTKKFLSAENIQYFGDPENALDIATSTCVIKQNKKTCIGFVGYHEFTYKNEDLIAQAITDLRPQVDFLIVFPHWGNEYNKKFTSSQQNIAHDWIDLGADVVIGAHPHIIEPIEIYKNKAIFYSLGNFIFDQYFSFDTTHGLTMQISLDATSTTYTLIPIQNTGIVVKKPTDEIRTKMLTAIASSSASTVGASIESQIANGRFILPH